jgi:hypothetical protein
VLTCLVGSSSLALAGTAVAASGGPASFCTAARSIADGYQKLDPTALTDSEYLARVERVWKKLATQAPSSLESAFRRINAFYSSLAGSGDDPIDFDDTAAFTEQARKVRRALKKVFTYLSSTCDLDLG